jgi:hypothetical protein
MIAKKTLPFHRPLIALGLSAVAAGTGLAPAQTGRAPSVAAPTNAPAATGPAPALSAAAAAAVLRQNPAAAAALRLPSVYAPTRPRVANPKYPWKTNIVTTVFWIGEPSTGVTAANNFKSSWDPRWQENYGGFDDPDQSLRTWDFRPRAFEPRLNPFYIALPFNDQTNKDIAPRVIPWYARHPARVNGGSVCKGQWLAIRFGKKICYAQWEDVGPFETDDWAYVFGRSPQPKTVMNNGVGLDISPAVRDYLGIVSGVRCDWRFCDLVEVPDGPWRKFGANNPFVKSREQELAERIKRVAELEVERKRWLENVYTPATAQ